MKYWWVNQNQTFRQESEGGYLWSPKRNKNNALNHFYETMREVAPGDVVFSFCNAVIQSVGIINSYGYESPRPIEFGKVGSQWDTSGWKVDVNYNSVGRKIRPKNHMDQIARHLPKKYSPIREDGGGNQVYLAEIPAKMAAVLVELIGAEAGSIVQRALEVIHGDGGKSENENITRREDEQQSDIIQSTSISETTKATLIDARRGQGQFKKAVAKFESKCRVTGVSNRSHLIASHIKPWRHSNNEERLDGHNGLLLSPNIDHLFDRGFISFAGDGTLLIAPTADKTALDLMGVPTLEPINVGEFKPEQVAYLDFHRRVIFKKSSNSG